MLPGGMGRRPSQHAGQFVHSSLAVHEMNVAGYHAGLPVRGLIHDDVPVGERGDLRQMRHDDDLVGPAQPGQPPSDLNGGASAHSGIDLVEDHGGDRIGTRQADLKGQHHSGQLASGRPASQREQWRFGVWLKQELNLVRAVHTDRAQLTVNLQAG